jgi:hypothetical protein
LPLALKLQVVGLVRLKRGKYHEPERASSFENRAMTRVLRQKRTLALAARFLADTGTSSIGKKTNFHGA